MNLISLLPENDKMLMSEYIYKYGVKEKNFIGLENYLKDWNESKKKLFRLLGNQFQVRVPFNYKKNDNELRQELQNLICESNFIHSLRRFLRKMENHNEDNINESALDAFWCLTYIDCFLKDEFPYSVKFKLNNGKTFQVQQGMKPIRVLAKIVNAFPENFIKDDFEKFRIAHSMCLNDKEVKGNVVISIHPFDYITMSDNDSDWSSCMSWTDDGCYHIGTIEMMNSNNVLCAYIESKNSSFIFDKDRNLAWNNKKWRQLFYITPDILVSGKPYPYVNDDITLFILNEIKKLAEENLNWTYSFGPERYLDMKHINSLETMDRNREWLHYGESIKNNILFDTRGMYNDMLNDNHTKYWCFRNKVKKMKIISYSGKAPCACCGNPALEESSYIEGYNDRFGDTDKIICSVCYDTGKCSICGSWVGKGYLKTKEDSNKGDLRLGFCERCEELYIRKCPWCGKDMILNHYYNYRVPALRITEDEIFYDDYSTFSNTLDFSYNLHKMQTKGIEDILTFDYTEQKKIIPIFICHSCLDKDVRSLNGIFECSTLRRNPERPVTFWGGASAENRYISRRVFTRDEILQNPKLSSTLLYNLNKSVEKKD